MITTWAAAENSSPCAVAVRVRRVSRCFSLGLAAVDVEPWEDVDDPAGGDDEDYVACAKQLYELCTDLAPRLF